MKMKLCFNILTLIFFAAPISAFAHPGHHSDLYHTINADEIKKKLASGNIIILDARAKDQDEKNRIPGAKSLPFNAPEKDIKPLLPSKDAVIVVYCSNSKCPASAFLAERLATLGYTNIYKYSEGINDWIKRGNHVDHAK